MATNVKLTLLLTVIAVFCFAQTNAQARKDSVHVKAKKDSLKVSEYAKIVYNPDNNRARLLPKTNTQTVYYKNHVTVVPPSNKSGSATDKQISIHPTPIAAVTGQPIIVGAPGKEYYYNPSTGESFKKKN